MITLTDSASVKVKELISQRSNLRLAIKEATENCIPLCSNCHRILHWEERETYKREKKRKKALKGAKKA